MIIVAHDGTGDYTTIGEAILNENDTKEILVKPGTYYEKIEIFRNNLSLIGSGLDKTFIKYDDFAHKEHSDGKPYGTFRTYSVFVGGDDITLKDMTIENTSGDGRTVGQAIALYADGDRIRVENCELKGHQDTLFCGPLPKSPRIPGSFIGPRENSPYRTSKQFYKNCVITGDIDFIFGSALAVFKDCVIVSRNRGEAINGYVTAASTWQDEPYGFVFYNCQFVGEAGIGKESVYLGRPWRPYGQTAFISCKFDRHIHNDHFDSWGDEDNKKTTRYLEIGCDYSQCEAPKEQGHFITIINQVDSHEMRGKINLTPWHQGRWDGN